MLLELKAYNNKRVEPWWPCPVGAGAPEKQSLLKKPSEAEGRRSDLEDRMLEFTAAEQNKEKRMKRNEDSLRHLWDNIKCNHIHIIGVPEEEERTDLRKYVKRL